MLGSETTTNKNIKTHSVEYDHKLAEYIIKRLALSIHKDRSYQFNDVVKQIQISIPPSTIPEDGRKVIYRGGYFWAEQDLHILKDKIPHRFRPFFINLRQLFPPGGTGLLHFYPGASNYPLYGINDYGKTKVKIYFLSCLIKFIRDLKENKTLTCKTYEVITNQTFADYLVTLGFKSLTKSDIVPEATIGAYISRDNLIDLEPKLLNKLTKYLIRKNEILKSNGNSRKNFDLF